VIENKPGRRSLEKDALNEDDQVPQRVGFCHNLQPPWHVVDWCGETREHHRWHHEGEDAKEGLLLGFTNNLRLGAKIDGMQGQCPVSYTHLDVYKRQGWMHAFAVSSNPMRRA